jgi:hypothetical protein
VIQRYFPASAYDENGAPIMSEDDDGDWVKWEDVLDLLDDHGIDTNEPDFSGERAILSVWSKGCHTELDFDTGVICVVSKDGLTRTPVYNQWTKEILVKEENS